MAEDAATTERIIVARTAFVVAVPFAARWPFEVHVRARRHGLRRLADLRDDEAAELAAALRDVVARYDALYGAELPYLLSVQEAPSLDGAPAPDHHLAVELAPPTRSEHRLKIRASVETFTGLFINDTLPEASAARLRALPVPAAPRVPVPRITHLP